MTESIFNIVTKILPSLGWGTLITFIAWAWKKSITVSVALNKNHEAGQKAMSQIDALTTNHFPHLESHLQDLSNETKKSNELLYDMATNIAILKDRGRL